MWLVCLSGGFISEEGDIVLTRATILIDSEKNLKQIVNEVEVDGAPIV